MENIQSLLALTFCISGLLGFLAPATIAKIVGIDIDDLKGKIEIQGIYGGFMFGFGLAALILDSSAVFQALGIAALAAGITRFIGLMVEKAQVQLNSSVILMIGEIVAGVLLLVN